MSVIIRGMNKSKSCADCRLRSNGYCDITDALIPYDGSIHGDCPLVELPEKHGELVDRNYLLTEYDRQHKGPAGGARKIMETAPIVVEAED